MGVWINSLVSVLIVSVVSFAGIITIAFNKRILRKILLFLVSFSAGALFAGAMLHLLPEAVEEFGFGISVSLFFLLGIVLFFILEKIVHWRHCHIPTSREHPHHLAVMNIVGDAFHNLIDGMIIGGAYLVNFSLGVSTTVAVVLHEIPQEIGDFGVLIHAGMSRARALFFNFLSALFAVVGVIISLLIAGRIDNYLMFLLPFTAGGFVYIAGADLIPELQKECELSKSLFQLLALILGIGVMVLFRFLE